MILDTTAFSVLDGLSSGDAAPRRGGRRRPRCRLRSGADCVTLAFVGRLITSGDLTDGRPEVLPSDRIDEARVPSESHAAHDPIVVQVTDC